MGYFPWVPLDPSRLDDVLPRIPGRVGYHADVAVLNYPSFHSTEAGLLEHGTTIPCKQGPRGQLGHSRRLVCSLVLVLLSLLHSTAEATGAKLSLGRLRWLQRHQSQGSLADSYSPTGRGRSRHHRPRASKSGPARQAGHPWTDPKRAKMEALASPRTLHLHSPERR